MESPVIFSHPEIRLSTSEERGRPQKKVDLTGMTCMALIAETMGAELGMQHFFIVAESVVFEKCA